MREIENFGNLRIRTARAYTSVHDTKARWPECNFSNIVNHSLENSGNEKFDILIMSAPTVDISNLNTANLSSTDSSKPFQQRAVTSAQNMFKLAEKSLEQNPSLTKIILMEHPPRFDLHKVDPTSLKRTLARPHSARCGLTPP